MAESAMVAIYGMSPATSAPQVYLGSVQANGKQGRPVFTGYQQLPAGGVPGDAVEYVPAVRLGEAVAHGCRQAAQVDPRHNPAVGRVYFQNMV